MNLKKFSKILKKSRKQSSLLGFQKFDSSGQAALTDSLFFLLIVSGVCTFMFLFVSSYGQSIDRQLLREYRQDYASSALKTIMYSSIPRIESEKLDDSKQVDYLLAELKEDFADDGTLNESQEKLKIIVSKIMAPFHRNADYMFYIYFPDADSEKFQFFLLSISSIDVVGSGREVTIGNSGKKIFYSCKPDNMNSVSRSLLSQAGEISQAVGRSKFLRIDPSGTEIGNSPPIAQIGLAMWIPKKIDSSALTSAPMNCTEWA